MMAIGTAARHPQTTDSPSESCPVRQLWRERWAQPVHKCRSQLQETQGQRGKLQ